MSMENSFIASEEHDGERLDKVLTTEIEGRSRSFLQGILKSGNVLLNGKTAKPSSKVAEGDLIEFTIPENIIPDILPENIPLDVIYEDDDILIVNKPKGMVVHPAPGHYTGTLVNAVIYHCGDSLSGINGVLRPGIVHRIDRDTTGSVIICKNDFSHQSIAEQLKNHSIKRKYLAIVHGYMKTEELTIDAPIGRDPSDRKKMAVNPSGKPAVTHARVLKHFDEYTLVECRLETGRTHQIRVHMTSKGYPLLGDEVYGVRKSPFKLEGQCLHAYILGFVHPRTGEYIETTAPIPQYFEHLLEIL